MRYLSSLQDRIRAISQLAGQYVPDFAPSTLNGFAIDLRGFGHSTLSLAVHKETVPVEFAVEQATFMLFLGEKVCPRILSIDDVSYVMEYLHPAEPYLQSIRNQEFMLENLVWKRSLDDVPYAKQIGDESWVRELEKTVGVRVPEWALDEPCLIHGDPTLDNTLVTKTSGIRIADPIPPHRLVRPSIRAVDHGKMLQSFVGWEEVLRGAPHIEYAWPRFMEDYETAQRAVFWSMVALKRIALRNRKCNAGMWAVQISQEFELCIS
jgi:hypothetical protein